jgi:THO complex subunit 1
LTEKAKKKIAGLDATNKSMLYNFTLSEDDSRWAVATRSNITNYLSSSGEGRLFNRMVETVLARDKNWVRWKVESCPTIVKEPVSTESELGARKGAREATRVRRLPDNASTMDLSFLDEGSGGGLEALTAHSRYHVSPLDGLLKGIQTDELDLDFADTDVEKTNLRNAMANKRWRIVRQARARQLQLLDKIEPGKDLSAVFHPEQPSEAENEDAIEQVVGSDVDRAAAENGEYKSEEKITVTENGETIGLNVVVTSGEEEVRNAPVIGEQATVTGGDAEQQMEVE